MYKTIVDTHIFSHYENGYAVYTEKVVKREEDRTYFYIKSLKINERNHAERMQGWRTKDLKFLQEGRA